MSATNILVGLSGGVDSSVAALRLQEQGEQIAGLFMNNWEEDERNGPCRAEEDRKDAVAIAAKLGIPFHTRNFSNEYWDQVFAHFLDEYRAGRTPNPDVLCNREIKFKTFLDTAHSLGFSHIATGHYARVGRDGDTWTLLRGVDRDKDQSYFLHTLGQHQLASTLFPIGELAKPEVRRIAQAAGIGVHDKKDSTGICFIGERDFREFLGHYIPACPGAILTPDGVCVGEHDGAMYYTLGQRSGLGIGGRNDMPAEPWYVVGKDVGSNIVYAVQGNSNDWLLSTNLDADECSWVSGAAPATEFRCTTKTRYRQPDQDCLVTVSGSRCEVRFDTPQRAVTPGQSVVFYQDHVCLGGATITHSNAPGSQLGEAVLCVGEQRCGEVAHA
ncbi:MAG: tRNA 2-thiouridine(34) synthase MnmA [Dokdonella sp.]